MEYQNIFIKLRLMICTQQQNNQLSCREQHRSKMGSLIVWSSTYKCNVFEENRRSRKYFKDRMSLWSKVMATVLHMNKEFRYRLSSHFMKILCEATRLKFDYRWPGFFTCPRYLCFDVQLQVYLFRLNTQIWSSRVMEAVWNCTRHFSSSAV